MLWGFLQTDWGQNWLAKRVTSRLSRDLQTKISLDHIRIGFFNKMDLKGVLVEDQKNDTLLYAGTLQVRITDWFFLKDQVELQYIGLENAQVNFNRTDSIWNYTFLEKYFASTDTTSKKKAGITFSLKKILMNNVSFVQKDAWNGTNLFARVKQLDMDADDISITHQTVRVKNLDLDEPFFESLSYKGNRPFPKPPSVKGSPQWDIVLSQVSINNGRFKSGNASAKVVEGVFNSSALDFSMINGKLKNFGWASDTLKGRVEISAKERSGLVVQSLKANTTIHAHAMIFEDLFLQTNRSTLTNSFAMRYKEGMSDFVRAVNMEANFKNATISSDDIAFFAPEAKTWNRVIKINGLVRGTVDAINAQELEIWAGNKTYINGNISLVGLPNFSETLINLEAKELRTTYADAVSFIPALRRVTTPDIRKLGYVRFRGTYTGFINDFVTYGTIQTGLGTLVTDLNMKLPSNAQPVYSGSISTSNFRLGEFLNQPKLGSIAMHGKVKGKSFDWNQMDLNFDGEVQRVEYGDYTYRNITAYGSFGKKRFNGDFKIDDPNADLELTGLINFSGQLPVFDMKANIKKANLRELNLSKENIELTGVFDLNIEGNSLSTLAGNARISNATLLHNGKRLSFDSLYVFSIAFAVVL